MAASNFICLAVSSPTIASPLIRNRVTVHGDHRHPGPEELRRLRRELEPALLEERDAHPRHVNAVEASGTPFDLGQRRIDPERGPVGTMRHHRLDDIGHGEHLGSPKDLVAYKPTRIAGTVATLVMLIDQFGN